MTGFNLVEQLASQGLLTKIQAAALEKEAKTRGVNPEDLVYEQKLAPEEKIIELIINPLKEINCPYNWIIKI